MEVSVGGAVGDAVGNDEVDGAAVATAGASLGI